ncbi:hypothetical protein IFM46972_07568 [Aspergillus udagawae]|uniref:Uncharacterized protein n=1 Tax=Aspergillus udagawae TaxID=91492 RepID=A0A8H3P3K3_9EURO|nr:hypothetical protein IFM46972_07568 [Aspergillus udagawae]
MVQMGHCVRRIAEQQWYERDNAIGKNQNMPKSRLTQSKVNNVIEAVGQSGLNGRAPIDSCVEPTAAGDDLIIDS